MTGSEHGFFDLLSIYGHSGRSRVRRTWIQSPYVIIEIIKGWLVPIPMPKWARWVTMDHGGGVTAWPIRPTPEWLCWEWTDTNVPEDAPDIGLQMIAIVQDPDRYDWKTCIVKVNR